MSYNGSGTFQINTSGQPVVTGTSISSTVFNALTADLATGLSTAITKDGQTTTTARIPFALGINSTLVTDATNTTSGSIITAGGVGIAKAVFIGTTLNVAGASTMTGSIAVDSVTDSSSTTTGSIQTDGGVGIAKALYVGTTANVAGAVTLGGVATFSAQPIFSSLTASSAVATDASKGLVSVTNTGTGNNVLATGPTISGPTISDGTANGVAYLNGSKVLTTGSALVFDASGNLGVGVTPSNALSTTKTLEIGQSGALYGKTSTNEAGLVNNYYQNSGGSVLYKNTGFAGSYVIGANHNWYTAPSGTAGAAVTLTTAMTLEANGNLTIAGATATKASGTTWANPSDIRLKDNIRDYAKGTTELMQVRVREWEYNGKGGAIEGMKGLGVVADEVMTVLPDTVENYDAKLNADDEETTAIKKFDATEITWLLVKTVQEQQAIITTLTDRITALEARNG